MRLALLFRMPLYKLANEMPYDEYVAWLSYLEEEPPERAADYRAAMIVSAFAGKVKLTEMFPTLAKRQNNMAESLKNSAFMQHILNAKGGDKINVD